MTEIRRLDRTGLIKAYGIESEPLLPWAALNAPFEGAWCVVQPGGESTAHAHHEYEVFIGLSGRSILAVDGERYEFLAGDIAHLMPGRTHHVINDGTEGFEFYAIWWDTDMSVAFLTRHAEETR